MAKIKLVVSATIEETFSDFIISKKTKGLAEKTLQSYQSQFGAVARHLDVKMDIAMLQKADLDAMIVSMRDASLSPNSINSYTRTLKSFFSWCNEQGMEQMDAMENELKKPVNTPIVARPITDKPKDVKTGRASDEYKEGMLTALRTNFRQIANVLQEGVDADGGYLVPEEYDNRLIDVLSEENIMRKLGHKITTSGEHKINIAATKPAAAWIEEGGALQFGDATFDQILLDAHKLHVAIKVTEELLYYKTNEVRIELYTDRKDLSVEEKVTAVLDSHGIFYTQSETWIESEKLYEVLFSFEIA